MKSPIINVQDTPAFAACQSSKEFVVVNPSIIQLNHKNAIKQ